MDITKNVKDLTEMISAGKMLEAFDKYYADNVTMQENETAPRVGKAANRKYEEAFVNGLEKVHDMKILGVATGDNYSTVESFMDLTHKDWGRVARTQVAVQHWDNGKIIKEKFYYTS